MPVEKSPRQCQAGRAKGALLVPIVFIPFGIFFGCCVAQFWFYRRVRQALIRRHPDLYLEMSLKAFSIDGAVTRFALSRKAKSLDDPFLTSAVTQARLLIGVAVVTWLVMVGLMITGLGFWPVAR